MVARYPPPADPIGARAAPERVAADLNGLPDAVLLAQDAGELAAVANPGLDPSRH